jgi:hypothetical protein
MGMRFKSPELMTQYVKLQPTLLRLCEDFVKWSWENGLPAPVATHIQRTRKMQEDIYWRLIMAQVKGMTEAEARAKARDKFSWHFVLCAIDFREYIYTPEQMAKVLDWFKRRTMTAEWEFLYHDVGRGKHLHVGIRDHQYAKSIPVT